MCIPPTPYLFAVMGDGGDIAITPLEEFFLSLFKENNINFEWTQIAFSSNSSLYLWKKLVNAYTLYVIPF